MEQDEKGVSPSDVVGDWVRELRRQRGWTAKDLEAECGKYGAADLTAASILNIETGRRDANGRRRRNVTIEELLVLSRALAVAPVNLLFPTNRPVGGDGELPPIAITPGHAVSDRLQLRRWAAGVEPLSDQDLFPYFDEDEVAFEADDERIAALVSATVQREFDQRFGDTAAAGRLVIEVIRKALEQGVDLAPVLDASETMIEGHERMAESVTDWRAAAQRIIAEANGPAGE